MTYSIGCDQEDLLTIAYYLEIDASWTDWQRSEIEGIMKKILTKPIEIGSFNGSLEEYLDKHAYRRSK